MSNLHMHVCACVSMCVCVYVGFVYVRIDFSDKKNQRTLFSVIIFKAGPSSKSYVKTRDQSTKCWHERVQNKLLR